jgi:ferredoxin-NADP reductase/Na+-translocating ferredoxin:NAD+ oxidoreductase RnfD subunit
MFSFIDDVLNRITMYRLVLYYLLALWGVSVVFDLFGLLPYQPLALVVSTALILAVCWGVNTIFASASGAATNAESVYITALILALIISPASGMTALGAGFIVFASAWAMGSKYIFAIGKKHIFNPAAFGVALAALTISQSANWWVAGNLWLLPFVFLGGLLVVRKLRRFNLIVAFCIGIILATVATTAPAEYQTSLSATLFHSAFFFLAFVMLTEPLTMPPGRASRLAYGALVGILFVPNVSIAGFYFTPELALLAGNLFAYVVSPKGRYILTLVEKKLLGTGMYEFAFASDRPFPFKPGQYLEWTLPHDRPDARGNRRYFTIASAPADERMRLGVRFYEPSSTFKKTLLAMNPGDMLSASHLAGNFVLPKNAKRKVAFIAGGIGITPFRSMVQHLLDTKDRRSAVLLYSNKTAKEIAYADVFERARRELGMKTIYAVTAEQKPIPGTYSGPIDADLIRKEIPDYPERTFYISGPRGMVGAFQKTLRQMGVPRWRIKVDFFPGFA